MYIKCDIFTMYQIQLVTCFNYKIYNLCRRLSQNLCFTFVRTNDKYFAILSDLGRKIHREFIGLYLVLYFEIFSRKNCFTSDYFKGCLDVLLLQDEVEKIQTWIKQLHGAEPGV